MRMNPRMLGRRGATCRAMARVAGAPELRRRASGGARSARGGSHRRPGSRRTQRSSPCSTMAGARPEAAGFQQSHEQHFLAHIPVEQLF